jgi:RHS repeat-associated protein
MTDQRGKNWDFEYTPMGRVKNIKDPLNNVWAYAYDAMGRLQTITYPDQQTETRTYDPNGNLLKREFTGGLTLTYAYDELNRMTSTGSAAVNLTYDSRNNITNTRIHNADFSAAYNDRSRIQTAGYDGQMTVTYTYDPRGLVSRVTDSLTSSWVQFTYDDDRFLIKIERSGGMTTDIERDANGRIRTLTHGTKGKLEFSFNSASEITKIIEDLPIDVQSFLASELKEFSYDDASQTAAAGFSYDRRGRRIADPERTYTWDGADRLTGVTKGATSVSYEYTALGEVAKRTENGVTTEYFYNYSIGGHPVMAEKKNNSFTRFYVYTPGGLLLYYTDLPNTPRFYHFNHLGTTLFLTDAAGNVTDSYGYTPYGQMVKHEGSSDQPFTYIGQHGVRQEGDTGLYHMRARYYDALTARFLSRDPAWNYENDPKSANPYPYAGQNPVSFIDPGGLDYNSDDPGAGSLDPNLNYVPEGFAPETVTSLFWVSKRESSRKVSRETYLSIATPYPLGKISYYQSIAAPKLSEISPYYYVVPNPISESKLGSWESCHQGFWLIYNNKPSSHSLLGVKGDGIAMFNFFISMAGIILVWLLIRILARLNSVRKE